MSTPWFYAQDNEQHGPLPSEELRRLLSSGKLTKATLVWSEGMESWVPAGKVEDLLGIVPPPLRPRPTVAPHSQPVVETESETYGQSSSPFRGASRSRPSQRLEPNQVVQQRSRQAWNRFLARTIDLVIAEFLVGLVFSLNVSDERVAFFLTPLALFLMIPIEAWCLSRWGMTLGKWIFRVRIVHADNRLLTFQEGVKRNFKVIVSGMACGVPLLIILFNVLAYKEYVDAGSTSWDRLCHTEVQHAPMRNVHTAGAIIFVVLFTLWMILANSQAA